MAGATTPPATTATTETSTTGTTAGKAIKVGLITDLGQLNDNGFNELAYNGLKRAERVLGVKGRVVESKSAADYVPNMTTLARQGYDLIIGVGFAQGDAIATAAKKFPKHELRDRRRRPERPQGEAGERPRPPVQGAGGRLPRRLPRGARGEARRRQAISAVGGFKEPPVDRYIAGYKAGAQAAVPGTVVKWGYSQDWDDQTKCKELGLNQIAAGSKVVFQVAGGCGLGALLAAKQQKVWGIGVDADQSFLGPHVLTSALKGVDTAVFLTVEGRAGRHVQGRRQRRLRPRPGRRRARQVQPEREQEGHRGDEEGRARDRRRADHGHPDDGRLDARTGGRGRSAARPRTSPPSAVAPSAPAAGGLRSAPSSRPASPEPNTSPEVAPK